MLDQLPPEMVSEITWNLRRSLKTMGRLSCVCRQLRQYIYTDQLLWKRIIQETFRPWMIESAQSFVSSTTCILRKTPLSSEDSVRACNWRKVYQVCKIFTEHPPQTRFFRRWAVFQAYTREERKQIQRVYQVPEEPFAKAFWKSNQLTYFFDADHRGAEHSRIFLEILCQGRTIPLTTVDLCGLGIGDAQLSQWTHLLTQFPLRFLRLQNNQLTYRAARACVTFFSACPSLEYLDVSHNEIEDKGVILLVEQLPRCGLKALDLSYNSITDRGCSGLAGAIPLSKLSWINLAENGKVVYIPSACCTGMGCATEITQWDPITKQGIQELKLAIQTARKQGRTVVVEGLPEERAMIPSFTTHSQRPV